MNSLSRKKYVTFKDNKIFKGKYLIFVLKKMRVKKFQGPNSYRGLVRVIKTRCVNYSICYSKLYF